MQFLSPKAHGVLDYIAALTLILAPFVLGFTGVATTYYLAMGVGVLAVVAVSSTSSQVVEEPIGASA